MFDVRSFLKKVTTRPGVYQMFNAQGKLLYVGKARNLKKRLSSYFQKRNHDIKTQTLVKQIDAIKVVIVRTENEALIVENNLIKKHRPKYNLLFRDDKSYPYIFISNDEFPRLELHRGPQKYKGEYFGPYPQGSKVREIIYLLRKTFLIRSCKNSFFRTRTRPCLQHQIHRCSAPCVRLTSKINYAKNIDYVKWFLKGDCDLILKKLNQQMKAAAQELNYELAKQCRDQVQTIRNIQSKQVVNRDCGDIDAIALVTEADIVCVAVLMIRCGQLLGTKTLFSGNMIDQSEPILSAFVSQYYFGSSQPVPKEIIFDRHFSQTKRIKMILEKKRHQKVLFKFSVRGVRAEWIKIAKLNAKQALNNRLDQKKLFWQKFVALQNDLKLKKLPNRIECFDVSHTFGQSTVAACVAFSPNGSDKQFYRRFNIKTANTSDDYHALYEALSRHYFRLKREKKVFPDVVMIDGGKGQLKQAEKVFKELDVQAVFLIAIAKGEGRKSGDEKIYISGFNFSIKSNLANLSFHLLQQIRDEAHRFAISGHRHARKKMQLHSTLDGIAGVGKKRAQHLREYFGGMKGILNASIDDFVKVSGISQVLAQKIYESLHGKV